MTRLVAHRGAALWAPENTVPAADLAIDMGASVIELDVRESADGTLYVLHDLTVDRTTDGTGPLHLLTDAQIDALDAGRHFAARFEGTRIPRLDAYLDHLKSRGAGAYVEVKWASPQKVVSTIRNSGIAEDIFTFSFKAEMREGLRHAGPEIRRMITLSLARNMSTAKELFGADMVELEAREIRPGVLTAAREAGLAVMGYTEGAQPAVFERMFALGLDFINHDHLDVSTAVQKARP